MTNRTKSEVTSHCRIAAKTNFFLLLFPARFAHACYKSRMIERFLNWGDHRKPKSGKIKGLCQPQPPPPRTRSRVTFKLFATLRNELCPQYFRSFAFCWWGSTRVWKKLQPMKFCVFSRGKTTENGSVSSQRSTWQSPKYLKIEGVFQFFDLWKNYFWNLHKICLLMVVLLSWCNAFSHSAVRLNLQ